MFQSAVRTISTINLNIRIVNNSDAGRWDEYVEKHPMALPYHLFAWKKAVENVYRHRAYYLLAEENNHVVGVLPLIYMKPPFISGQLISLPFCDVGDVLAGDEKTRENLLSEAIILARESKSRRVELRGQDQQSSYQFINLPVRVQSHKVRMFLELPDSSEILWDRFKSKHRSQIRKAEKNGLVFKWGSIEDLDDFYYVFSMNMRDLGSPVHSKAWFAAVFKYFGESARMGLVYHENYLTGVGIILSVNRKISIPWASTLKEFNRFAPNMLLYWNFLKYAADNGYSHFDFGRSTTDEGTYKFKAQWGARPVPLHWHHIMLNGEKLHSDTSSSSARDRIAKFWQKLPLPLANRIGPSIRRHISL